MTDRVFIVKGVPHAHEFRGIILVPESVPTDAVIAAWSNAVRYTAKGYDVPDCVAALALIAQRHPDWHISPHPIVTIDYNPTKADIDEK